PIRRLTPQAIAIVTSTTTHQGVLRSTCSSHTSALKKGCDIDSKTSAYCVTKWSTNESIAPRTARGGIISGNIKNLLTACRRAMRPINPKSCYQPHDLRHAMHRSPTSVQQKKLVA